MSENWYLLDSPIQTSGFEGDYFNDYAVSGFNDLLDSFISEEVTVYDSILSTSEILKGIVQSKINNSSFRDSERQILLPLGTYTVGDYIYYKNNHWIVKGISDENKIYQKIIMKLCTFTLKWQDTNGTILSYPCITDSKRLGEADGKVITLGNNEKSIILPLNEITVLLRNGKRFFLDKHPTSPIPYKVIGVDTTSYDGLVELIVREDELNPNVDRVDLGICDYFEPTTPPDPIDPEIPQVVVTINHDAIDNEVKLGLTYNFSASFTREDGSVVETTNPKYTINTTYGGLITFTDNGNGTATVKVKNDAYDLVTEQVTLECMDMYSGFSSAVTLTIVGMW